jgi:hypothetical protein
VAAKQTCRLQSREIFPIYKLMHSFAGDVF